MCYKYRTRVLMKSCFMFGHSDCPDSMLPTIEKAIEKCHSTGITAFYVGNRGKVDGLAATAVKRAKERHTDIIFAVIV